MSSSIARAAVIALQAAKVPGNPDQISIQWSPGSTPYTLYRSYTVPIGGSESLPVISATSFTLTMPTPNPGDIAFFRISDATSGLPQATVTSPAAGATVTTPTVTATGTVNGAVTRVWINKSGAMLTGNNFSAANVPLVFDENTFYATALTLDQNISVRTTQILRDSSNTPSAITIVSPATGSQVADVTPFLNVTIEDAGSFDIGTFTAYLDGVDKSSSFTKSPTSGNATSATATWQLPDVAALTPGTHTLQVTIKDAAGFTNTAISTFRITGPVIAYLLANGSLYILGDGFGTASNTTVFFTGANTNIFMSITSTQIHLAVPAAATDGPLYVRVNGIDSEPINFDRSFSGIGVDAAWVAIDAQDRVYYVDDSDRQRVRRIPQDGSSVASVFMAPASEMITGISFDAARTTLYIVTRGTPTFQGTLYLWQSGYIYSLDLAGHSMLRKVLLQDPVNSGPYSDPAGIDVVGSVAYVNAVRPDTDKVVLAVDLISGATANLLAYPLGTALDRDIKLDSLGNIYTVRTVGGTGTLYQNATQVYNLTDVGALHIDCLDRVWFTDMANNGAFDGGVYRLQGTNSATQIPTGTSPQNVFGIDSDSMGNVFIGSPTSVTKISTQLRACEKDFTVGLTGDADKILADYDPVQATEVPNTQFVVLTACLGEPTIPRSAANRVVWEAPEDIDDPATDLTIDSNGTNGNDNKGSLEAQAPYSPEPGYALVFSGGQFRTSYDGSGCSKVRFHPTDSPGDNFAVTAVAETLLGNNSARSGIMTVWKRLHLELDSMGRVTGPLDPQGDDALIGEVPDPDTGLLVNAFKPAYIDVVFTPTAYNTPDVSFDTHVPDSILGPDQLAEMLQQAAFPSIRGSQSVNGDWWAYIQGGYEGWVEKDNDPPGEDAALGATGDEDRRASLMYLETVRDAASEYGLDEAYLERVYLLHEIGHQFGMEDLPLPPNVMTVSEEGGPLRIAVPYFVPSQLLKLRCQEGTEGCPPPSRLP